MSFSAAPSRPKLTVLVATCNRIEQLKVSVESILSGTRSDLNLVVADGGSTDGTQEYLTAHPRITPVLQGRKLGPAKSYNEAWRGLNSDYTCWLSDDTELVPGSLDLALDILRSDTSIGMVGLKTRDTMGPWVREPYIGGISEYGILNCNHGVLPMKLLRQVGYFNEDYKFYYIDPDLTARVLCAGRKVVFTRRVAVRHHRAWSQTTDPETRARDLANGQDAAAIYRRAFAFLKGQGMTGTKRTARALAPRLIETAFSSLPPDKARLGLYRRDVHNILNALFIRLADPLLTLGKPYHLVQAISDGVLKDPANPCRELAAACSPGGTNA